ncbi:MAG TPA: glycosyltransferase family 2 protein [Candidatus Nanoarchaeia archaeon]|nr:glycosyltransferase family 2 protein [Candidatus Nanoarchaeia archaeon]
MKKYSCIIPFYNEEKTEMNSLKEVSKIKKLEKIICVDDGSTDNSSKIIKRKYPEFELIKLKENKGKTEAIRQGIKKIKTKYVLLIDADLKNLKSQEIEKAIEKSEKENPNMVILKRIKAPFHIKLFRLNTLLSGERIIKTKDLREILKGDCQNYQIEVAINDYMSRKKKKVFWLPYSGENIPRKKKWGIHKSPYFKMYIKLLVYIGIIPALKQIALFCRKKI